MKEAKVRPAIPAREPACGNVTGKKRASGRRWRRRVSGLLKSTSVGCRGLLSTLCASSLHLCAIPAEQARVGAAHAMCRHQLSIAAGQARHCADRDTNPPLLPLPAYKKERLHRWHCRLMCTTGINRGWPAIGGRRRQRDGTALLTKWEYVFEHARAIMSAHSYK